MSKFRISVLSALIILAFGVTVIGDAIAGERIKYRSKHCNVMVNWDPTEVAEKPGHVIGRFYAKGIGIILEGTSGGPYKVDVWGTAEVRDDGYAVDCGYGKFTYPDGSYYMVTWKDADRGKGTSTYYGGTGRFKGMKGGEKFDCTSYGDRFVCDIEAWMELP